MLKTALKYFFIFFLFSVVGVWISNNYGTVDIFWLGYKVHTSIPVLLLCMWFIFFLVGKCMVVINWLFHPKNPFKKVSK